MSLDEALLAPLSEEEIAGAKSPKKPVEKKPIIPVPDDAAAMQFKHPVWGAPVKVWPYHDAAGRLLFYDGRFEWTDKATGEARKEVIPIAYCHIGKDKPAWRSKSMPAPRALYGLDRLALRPEAPVLVVEGCKCADVAAGILPEYVVVTWPGGGNGVSQSDWVALKDRDVLIWPDRDRQHYLGGDEKDYSDQPGTIAADAIIGRIRLFARSVRVLDLEDWPCPDGWDVADAVGDGWDAQRITTFMAERAKEVDTSPGTAMPFLFEYGDDGIYFVGDADEKRMRICGRVKILAKTRDLTGRGWGLLLELRDDDGRVHRWPVPRTMLSGDGNALREALLDRGLFVSTISKARTQFMRFFSEVNTSVKALSVSTVGWSRSAFVLPDRTIGDTPDERTIYQNPQSGAHEYGASGTLEEWQEHVAKLAIGNSRFVFMIAASFVGPLLEPMGEEGGGFNAVGNSSSGKTSILRGAVSVWGGRKYMKTWRATDNALEGVCAQHSQTALYLDEIGQLDAKVAGSTAYMMVNGDPKERQNRGGGNRAGASWNVMFLSTGERGLADLVKEAAQNASRKAGSAAAGQEIRILDFPADAGAKMGVFEKLNGGANGPDHFARTIKANAAKYYGTASIAYLEDLVTIIDSVGEVVGATMQRFVEKFVPENSDSQVLRASRRFALVAAAGELAIARSILPWPRGEAFDAAGLIFKAWLGRRGGTGSAEQRNILSRLRHFLQMHGESRFQPLHPSHDDDMYARPVMNRAGYWRQTKGAGGSYREFLIAKEQMEEIFDGLDYTNVVKTLRTTGVISPDPKGKSAHSIAVPGMSNQRLFVINTPMLGDGDVADDDGDRDGNDGDGRGD